MSTPPRSRWSWPGRLLSALLAGIGWLILAPVRVARYLVLSVRFWVLLLLVLFGILVIYYSIAHRYTPLSTDAFVQGFVVQIAPRVPGQVIRVHVREGATVQSGDLLFELDPRPFEHKVAQLQARQVEVRQEVRQLDAQLIAARAEHSRLEAEASFASTVRQQEQRIYKASSTTERKFLDAVARHKASEAAVARAAALIQHAQEAIDARLGNEHALIARSVAELNEARLNLTFTRIHAPCAGVITNLQLCEGSFVRVGEPVLTVIDTRSMLLVGNFREGSLEYLSEGQPALVGLRTRPGHLFPAHVTAIGQGISRGQGIPSGTLPDIKREVSWVPPEERFQVRLMLDETLPDLRVGMTGSVSIYVEEDHRINPITRWYHQLIAWLYYL